MGLRWRAGDRGRRRLPSHATDRRRSWSVTAGVRPAVMQAYPSRHDGGGVRARKPVPPPPPPPPTPPPGTTPPATPPRVGPPGPGRRRRVRHRTGTTAPRIQRRQSSTGRPCRPVRPYSRLPRCSTTGRARGGGGGGAGRRRRCGGGGARGRGWGRQSRKKGEGLRCCPPPASLSRCGDSLGGGTGVSSKMTDDKRMANKRRLTRGFQCHASTNSPQKTQTAIGMGERRWQDSFWQEKVGPGIRLS
jgi:hypothetical protein